MKGCLLCIIKKKITYNHLLATASRYIPYSTLLIKFPLDVEIWTELSTRTSEHNQAITHSCESIMNEGAGNQINIPPLSLPCCHWGPLLMYCWTWGQNFCPPFPVLPNIYIPMFRNFVRCGNVFRFSIRQAWSIMSQRLTDLQSQQYSTRYTETGRFHICLSSSLLFVFSSSSRVYLSSPLSP